MLSIDGAQHSDLCRHWKKQRRRAKESAETLSSPGALAADPVWRGAKFVPLHVTSDTHDRAG
jgi:hypothetical protein